MLGLAVLRRRNAGGDERKQGGSRLSQHVARFLKPVHGGSQGLVRDVDFFFQGIQLGVLENFPPFSLLRLVARLRRFPVCILLVRGRNLRRGF